MKRHGILKPATFALLLAGLAVPALASATPEGRWRTVDDKTHKEKSIVEITEVNGELQGKVVKLLNRGDKPANPICDKCEGDRKGKPVIGMTILWGLKQDGDEWSGGEILDPESGETYDAKLALEDEGQKLEVRGFLGISLLGRTQTWARDAQQ
ncbi:MAG: DUF2147 domain-containing protein [Parvibaculum sp.]|uniref:DUF2147 domain-containing protein n=1 Tax=Parvibaculum sp. TaxID=2024848 RepID=UPI0025F5EF6A|nr:DUF2147 domain-containing protein [Parvibaculum sp.]MCE9649935.1 DUF2147 domain-containing protein [Parvibaculum sp.]